MHPTYCRVGYNAVLESLCVLGVAGTRHGSHPSSRIAGVLAIGTVLTGEAPHPPVGMADHESGTVPIHDRVKTRLISLRLPCNLEVGTELYFAGPK